MTIYKFIKDKFNWVKERATPCVLVVFVVWMIFFDQNSVLVQMKIRKSINSLSAEKQYYMDLIARDSILLNELKTNDNNLEKFVREQYFMKAADEDVFEIVERP
ncbi:MAG: septum formation inhibitor [Bacteroidales bacterium]|nr:septum formation inhibitor [Bacteroidales bacterium]MBO7464054.1 septum formation inhibitor [Bacteroidales bacterium]MBO7568580.1 septum formation inhibitor [Bacteroidales bacterium]